MKKVFTTGQVAKLCNVASRTVLRWFDSGRLRGYRIPGSQDRRIPRTHLIRFLKEFSKPIPDVLDDSKIRVLFVGMPQADRESLYQHFCADAFKIHLAKDGFEVEAEVGMFMLSCILIDFAMGCEAAIKIAQNLRKDSHNNDVVLIGILSPEDFSSGFDRSVFNETFRTPFDNTLLVTRIETLVRRRREGI